MTNRSEKPFPDWLERNGSLVAVALLVIYLARAAWEASSKPLWFDEFFTFHYSRVGGPAELWKALLSAGEALPPLGFLLTAVAHLAFGEGEVATRLPSILAFGAFGYGMYRLLSPHIGVACALAAMVFSWITSGFDYGIEARPYALMICFGVLALVSWRAAAEGKQATWGPAAMAMALMLALSVHYYSVFLFLPVAAGELARWRKTRKLDLKVWGGLALAGATLLFYLPLIASARERYSEGFWSPVLPFADILGTYIVLLSPAVWALTAVVCLLIGGAIYRAVKKQETAEPERPLPAHELVALLTAAAIPIFAVGAASLTTGVYVYRYGLGVLIGICAGFGFALWHATRGRNSWRWAVVALLAGWFALGGPRPGLEGQGRTAMGGSDPYGYEKFRDPALRQDVPIVVSSPVLYPEHYHYAPDWAKERLIYVADPAAAVRYRQTNTPDLNLIGVAPWSPLTVVPYDEFMSRQPYFLIHERPLDRFAWLIERLRDEGRRPVKLIDGPLEVWECCGEP